MRFLVITLMVLSITCSAIAENKASAKGSEQACAGTGHTHQYSDIRIAAIEITRVDECGIGYADLEENTVGLDNHFMFDAGFEIILLERKASNSGEYQTVGATRSDVNRGMRAVAVYCQSCRAVLNLKSLSENEIAIRGWNR
ncbi:MAG TPA: hypothetical protein VLD57_09330 [Blastocatellia bacterium]|nr:hypothetical protein [Blastocatellia bacterium]